MSDLLQFLRSYGYVIVFAGVFIEQIGFPLPAATLLIGMGALSRSGDFAFEMVIAVAVVAAILADLTWYELGYWHGRSVLRRICGIALEPDSCVRRTEDMFERLGLWALFPAKFVPGFNAATVPLAGMMNISVVRFLAMDSPAVVLWAGAYVSLGYIFSQQIEVAMMYASKLGKSFFILFAGAIALYILHKVAERRRFLRELAVSRITPEELKAKIDAGENIMILDLRNRLDLQMDPVRIPGAFHVLPEHIEFHPEDIPPDCDVVLYCTCPNEATSARVTLQLQRIGLKRARPLEGGLDAWRERKLPIERLD
jgi:membrane protein DedA with SNARE-associated domain/rhodanese-related sulfurtransferase